MRKYGLFICIFLIWWKFQMEICNLSFRWIENVWNLNSGLTFSPRPPAQHPPSPKEHSAPTKKVCRSKSLSCIFNVKHLASMMSRCLVFGKKLSQHMWCEEPGEHEIGKSVGEVRFVLRLQHWRHNQVGPLVGPDFEARWSLAPLGHYLPNQHIRYYYISSSILSHASDANGCKWPNVYGGTNILGGANVLQPPWGLSTGMIDKPHTTLSIP